MTVLDATRADTLEARVENIHALALEDLGALARREAREANAAAVEALEHARLCGAALLEVRGRVKRGEWTDWIAAEWPHAPATAYRYMRVAYYWRSVPEHVDTIDAARRSIRDLPPLPRKTGFSRPDADGRRAEARRLKDLGATVPTIAEEMGLHSDTVYRYLSPRWDAATRAGKRRRLAERHEARALAVRRKQEAEVKRRGGSLAHIYAHVRRAIQASDQATPTLATIAERRDLDKVIAKLYAVEDALAAMTRGRPPSPDHEEPPE